MSTVLLESFSWCNTTALLAVRYNTTAGSGGVNLTNGRFGNGCLTMSGNNFQTFPFRATITPTIRFGVAIYCTDWSLASATGPILVILGDALATQCYLSVDGSTKKVQARNGANTLLGTGSLVLQNNSWYYFELLITVNNATGTFACSIDGVSQFALTGVNTRSVATTNILGIQLKGATSAFTQWSDLNCSDAGPMLGDARTVILVPTGDGSASAWTPSTGVTLWSLVDEIPPNGDTDYISSATPGQQALFTMSDLPYTPAAIYSAQSSCYARKDDAAARSIANLVRSGGTTVAGATQVITSSYLDAYLDIWDVNPVTAVAWTAADINALEAGVTCVA